MQDKIITPEFGPPMVYITHRLYNLKVFITTWHEMRVVRFVQHNCVDESVLIQEEQSTVDAPVYGSLLWLFIFYELQMHMKTEPKWEKNGCNRSHGSDQQE